jgi:hypothetical protein
MWTGIAFGSSDEEGGNGLQSIKCKPEGIPLDLGREISPENMKS